MNPPLAVQRYQLPLKGVLLHCLDETGRPLPGAFASGFIRREEGSIFLYTCWHVVSGFNPNDVRVGLSLPLRRHLKVSLQAAEKTKPGLEVVGGLQTFVIPLYDTSMNPPRPRWLQDDQHVPHADLNAIGLHVPYWHDVVKLELPPHIHVSDIQVIDETRVFKWMVGPGYKCLIVGFPYGFSAFGQEQPTPIALTRFIASSKVAGRRQQLLLESIGAPGMSGAPVFIENGDDLLMFGIYTGLIYPDYGNRTNEMVTALGTISNLSWLFTGDLALVAAPSTAVPLHES